MLLSLLLKNLPRILIAMTRRPLSASISRTVMTVSYRIELPTFLVESVFVATCGCTFENCDHTRHSDRTYLSENIIHGFARSRIAPSQEAHQAQDLDLEEWVRNPGNIVFGTISSSHQCF